ncbi:MAG: DUF4124 domain-containing protein [Betaproteobacteria bacterium]|jgi:hypothetical protein|nr:MAG: DUF4124 domain-containing protein [Betaproteobacteria bacterium]
MKASKGWARLTGLAVLLAAASTTTTGQTTYRWDDIDGQTHYSDQPPPPGARNVKEVRNSRPASENASDNGEVAPSYQEQEAAFRERQAKKAEEQAEAEKQRLAAAERKKNCELARSNYNTISVGGRITRVNKDGEREFLSSEEIEKETVEARSVMEQWCDD